MPRDGQASVLAKNSLWLTLVVAANYLFGFLLVPYLTRVLSQDVFGFVGVGQAVAIWLQLVVDFGFVVSGTASIARAAKRGDALSPVFSQIMWGKVMLALASCVMFAALVDLVPGLKAHPGAFISFALAGALAGLTPDFAYRGIEQMAPIAARVAATKLLTFLGVLLCVRSDGDWILVPLFTIVGNLAGVVWMVLDLRRRGSQWVGVPTAGVWRALTESSLFFWSRIAANLYTSANTFVLGVAPGVSAVSVAQFIAADKLGTAAASITSPVADSLYPRMMHSPRLSTVGRVLGATMPVLVLCCAGVWRWASELCAIVFGPSYSNAGQYVRVIVLIVVVKYVGVILGFPALSPIGLSRLVNVSVIIGALVQLLQIGGMIVIHGGVTAIGVCWASLFTQVAILCIKGGGLLLHRDRYLAMQESGDDGRRVVQ